MANELVISVGDITFLISPENIEISEGMSATFQCEAMVSSGSNSIMISWFTKNGSDFQTPIDANEYL